MGYSDVQNNFSINYYFSYILWLIVAAGVLFEMPVLVMILSSIGLVTPTIMRRFRRHAYVSIMILSAVITPPDPISLGMMTFPLIMLYEVSILISKFFADRERLTAKI